jgi:hypothetical protein
MVLWLIDLTSVRPAPTSFLLRGIQLTLVQRYWGSTVKMLFSYKIFTFYDANTLVSLPNACARTFLVLSQQ